MGKTIRFPKWWAWRRVTRDQIRRYLETRSWRKVDNIDAKVARAFGDKHSDYKWKRSRLIKDFRVKENLKLRKFFTDENLDGYEPGKYKRAWVD